MNKRQAKKYYNKRSNIIATYHGDRKIGRLNHEASIQLARKEHRNYWEEWTRGYPNRFPYGKWYKSMTPYQFIRKTSEEWFANLLLQ